MTKDPHKNIALPDSLLSRFDLLFVVADEIDDRRDRMISEHVLRMHRYLQPGLEEGTPALDNLDQVFSVGGSDKDVDGAEDGGSSAPFERYNPLLHAGITASEGKRGKAGKKEVLTIAFVKKFIQYAKSRIQPVLTKGAAEYIVNVYANLRNSDLEGNQKRTSPLTARTLETLIRLATAHAKSRLSREVGRQDAEAAEEILRFALFKEVKNKKKKAMHKKQRMGDGSSRAGSRSDSDDSDDSDDDSDPEIARPSDGAYRASGQYGTRGAVKAGKQPAVDDMEEDLDAEEAMRSSTPTPGNKQIQPIRFSPNGSNVPAQAELIAPPNQDPDGEAAVDPARYNLFRSRISEMLRGAFQEEESIALDVVLPAVNAGLPSDTLFSNLEARQALQAMSDANDILFADGEHSVGRNDKLLTNKIDLDRHFVSTLIEFLSSSCTRIYCSVSKILWQGSSTRMNSLPWLWNALPKVVAASNVSEHLANPN